MKIELSRVPSVLLPGDVATKLKATFGLGHSAKLSSVVDLKEIVQHCQTLQPKFDIADLVRGLLLTPKLGRYVTYLVPYCKSVFQILNNRCIYMYIPTITPYCKRLWLTVPDMQVTAIHLKFVNSSSSSKPSGQHWQTIWATLTRMSA